MTNREESNAAEHETYPGPGPLKADEAKRGIRPVEQMVDAAIERIALERAAREAAARAAKAGSSGAASAPPAEPGHAITLARSDAEALMATAGASSEALALDSGGAGLARTDRRGKGRLRWKGLEVSDEFRSYAERVARGEDLAPFTGKILAEPDQAFPWDPKTQKRAARRALKQQIGLWTGVTLFLGLSIAVLVVQVRKQADSWQARESPLAAVPSTAVPSTAVPSTAVPSSVTLSSVTLANQPSTGAPENAPAAFNEPSLDGAAAPSGADTAGEATVALHAAPSAAATPAGAARVAAPAQRPVAAPKAAASPGVLVATRAPSPEGAGPATVGASASNGGEPALRAMGTAGTAAGASASSGADLAGSGDPASALRADPKKEPTREASGMGSLLVESPSF